MTNTLFLSEQAEDAGLAAARPERSEKALQRSDHPSEGVITTAGLDLLLFPPLLSPINYTVEHAYKQTR